MKTIAMLIAMMARLRDPETGCPWDRAQDFRSILGHSLEEIYELADAIERDDPDAIRDELGDLLFHVVFYARMAEEAGRFDFADVVATITDKLERRHPHVFADAPAPADGNRKWEADKLAERRDAGARGALEGVPAGMPALLRAMKLQKRAAAVGFDWTQLPPVLDKLQEEIAELQQALAQDAGRARVAEETGDLLFSAVNVARHAGVDPEVALRAANRKFTERFAALERVLAARGRRPEQAGAEELEEIWQALKR